MIRPYPDNPPPALNIGINGLLDELGVCAKKHPLWFSAGAIAARVGGLMFGPGLVALG